VRVAVLAAALSFVVSLMAAGCGGDSNAATQLSAAQWRAQADAICRRTVRELRRHPPPKTDGEIAPFVAAVTPLWKGQADELRALDPPDELTGAAAAYVTDLDYLARWLVELTVARERGDGARADAAVTKIQGSARSSKQKARDLELKTCGRMRAP
jgi:nitrous oxide reductase accessory protein NosL